MSNEFKVGDLVVRSKDWIYGNQDENSVYGKITEIEKKKYQDGNFWASVEWIDYKGFVINSNSYRIGPACNDVELYNLL